MGLFFPSDPVIHGQRATGLPRYQELLERDWKSFLFADFVTLGLCTVSYTHLTLPTIA